MIGTRPLKIAANEANPNKLPQVFRDRAGELMAGSLRYYRGTVASDVLSLPADAKAAVLANGVIIASGGATGPLDVVAEDATPAAGQAQITASGDIGFAAADAVTEAEVWYFAYGMDTVTLSIVVDPSTGLGSLSPYQAVRLVSAEALTGSVTGVASVEARSDAQPSGTGLVNLNLDGANVEFLIADAVESATVTFVAQPGFGPAAETVAGQMAEESGL